MAEKEIKITFPEVKMEALEFFLREKDTTVETILKDHLEKMYEKSVPEQVRKFVESKIAPQQDMVQEDLDPPRPARGQGRRSSRNSNVREAVCEQEDAGMTEADTLEQQDEMVIAM